MARVRRTPAEKKRLSLARDTPLQAKYPKGFRKHWPRRKAMEERSYRAALRRAVADGTDPAGVARRAFSKWTQAPLGEVIAEKLSRRARLRTTPRKSPEARARRALRRGRKTPG